MDIAATPPYAKSRKIGGWLAAVVAALFATYLAAMNVFLGTRIFRNLISFDPEGFRLEYARAYSLLPGRIHVEGLAIRGRDGSIEWILNLERCDFHVSFFDLARRKFHASHVRGHGLSFRVRLRVASASPAHLAALPPVPGFPDPPAEDSGPPMPPLTDANYKLWGVQLDDVDADPVRELWIDTLRYTGDFRVRGRWLFHPVRWLDVGPAVIDVRTLDLDDGPARLITDAHGVIQATVHPFDVRIPRGLEILDYVSARVDFHGQLHLADAVNAFTLPGVFAARGEGPLNVSLFVDHGVLEPETEVTAEAPTTEANAAGVTIDAALRARLGVTRDALGKPAATATLTAAAIHASRRDGAKAQAAEAKVSVTSRELKLSHAFGDAAFDGGVETAETQSLQPWLSRASQMRVQSGPAVGSGHFEGSVPDQRAGGQFNVAIDHLAIANDTARVMASVDAAITVANASLRDRVVALSDSHVTLRDVLAQSQAIALAARSVGIGVQGSASLSGERLTGRIAIEASDVAAHDGRTEASGSLAAHAAGDYSWMDGTMHLGASEAVLHDVTVRIARADLRAPSVTVSTPRFSKNAEGFQGSVALAAPQAAMSNLAAMGDIVPLPKDITVEHGSASAALDLAMELPSRVVTGRADVDIHALNCHLASKELFGNAALRLRARADGVATVLSGSTFAFESTGAPAAGAPATDGWWARADLPESELRAEGALALSARVHFMASDASPIAALIASRTPLPRWLLGAVPMNGLDITGELRVEPASLDVRSLSAHGGSDRVELEYAARGEQTAWALLVEAGPMGTSFHMENGHMDFVLLDARSWYNAKVAGLRKSSAQ